MVNEERSLYKWKKTKKKTKKKMEDYQKPVIHIMPLMSATDVLQTSLNTPITDEPAIGPACSKSMFPNPWQRKEEDASRLW